MAKISIIVLADTESRGDMGRMANALTTAQECMEAGDEFEVLFDGAGTKWIAELTARDHKLAPAFETVRDHIAGACDYCAKAFGVRQAIQSSGVALLDEYNEHPSLRRRVENGFAVITF
jgi:hypothetical protein